MHSRARAYTPPRPPAPPSPATVIADELGGLTGWGDFDRSAGSEKERREMAEGGRGCRAKSVGSKDKCVGVEYLSHQRAALM